MSKYFEKGIKFHPKGRCAEGIGRWSCVHHRMWMDGCPWDREDSKLTISRSIKPEWGIILLLKSTSQPYQSNNSAGKAGADFLPHSRL